MTADKDERLEHLLSPVPVPLDLGFHDLSLHENEALSAIALEVFHALNHHHFLGLLSPIPIELCPDLPYKAVLHYRPRCRVIISEHFVRGAGIEGMRQAVLHEMVHYFFHFHGIRDTSSPILGHSRRFRYVGDRVGLTLYS